MRTADCDDELISARVEIYGINHEVEDRITVHPVNGIAGIIEATPELPLKVRLVPKRRDLPIVESYDLVTDKNSRSTGYRMLANHGNAMSDAQRTVYGLFYPDDGTAR